MNTKPLSHPTAGLSVILLVLMWAVAARAAESSADVKKIAELSGVRVGLCLHLGCGRENSADLTAALAKSGNWAVHGLALDEAALLRARKEIAAQGLAGRAMVENIAVNPLPYLNDLANLIVVEDLGTLTAKGVTQAELLRVLAPGGTLCVREGVTWKPTVKARPKEMDEWTHPCHGADGNMVSTDKVFKFPIGLRWINGLPVNINKWAACRAWVVAGGRCYTLSSNDAENVDQKLMPHYLSAFDAYNGMPLWKINCNTSDDGALLNWRNAGPLAADSQRVYAIQNDKLIIVDGATGQITATCATQYPSAKMMILDGMVLVSGWEQKVPSDGKFSDGGSLWSSWMPKNDKGSIEAFDAKTGEPKWKVSTPAFMFFASNGVVYALTQNGTPTTERAVVAFDLKSGKEKWRVPHTQFGADPDIQLNNAGAGYVIVSSKRIGGAIFVLGANDGKVLWKIQPAAQLPTPVINGVLWNAGKKYNPLTGEESKIDTSLAASIPFNMGTGPGAGGCTPSTVVGQYVINPRARTYTDLGVDNKGPVKKQTYAALRGACIEGLIPANGMIYTAQLNCVCTPGQVYGFAAAGPCGELPVAADFEKARPVTKGPAFGPLEANNVIPDEWPTYRHDAERSGATPTAAPDHPLELWKVQLIQPKEVPATVAWKARLDSALTAPVISGGLVFIAGTDTGELFACNATNGQKVWSTLLGGRVDSPPTLYRGLCIVGCHDGWVYALRAKDGQLAWRTRIAPWERRMAVHGQMESVWPAIGSVLVHNGTLYANAGRTSDSDGGIAVVALNPATGEQVWGTSIGAGLSRLNDLMIVRDGQPAWYQLKFDPKTGAHAIAQADNLLRGILDGVSGRKEGAFLIGKLRPTWQLSWNSELTVSSVAAFASEAIALDKVAPLWQLPIGGSESLVLAKNVIVNAGRTRTNKQTFTDLSVISTTDGKLQVAILLPERPTLNGIALSGGKIFVSLRNGMLFCFGK